MSFLPDGYETLKTEKPYMKLSELKDGDTKFRIVCKPIGGWLDWHNNKPVRYRPHCKPAKPFNPEKPIKPFWACYVWDYSREGLFILEITQSSILKALRMIAEDEDWGDFTQYDIKINKKGAGKETRYALTPLPHKPLLMEIQDALQESPVRLAALYEGGDPWTDLDELEVNENTGEVSSSTPVGSAFETLREHLEIDGIRIDGLNAYIAGLSVAKGQKEDMIIESALRPQLLPKFKSAYLKHLEKSSQAVAV